MDDPTQDEIRAYLGSAPTPSGGQTTTGGDPTQEEIKSYLGGSQQVDDPYGFGSTAATPPPSPHTDGALKSLMDFAKAPSPAWMQPIERGIRNVAEWKGLVKPVYQTNPLYWGSRYEQAIAPLLPRPLSTVAQATGDIGEGLAKGAAEMVTPFNAALALLNPPTAVGRSAVAAMFTGQAIAQTPGQIEAIKKAYQAGDTSAVTQHAGELVGSYLPATHFLPGGMEPLAPRAKPGQPLPKTGITELTPKQWILKYGEAPEDLRGTTLPGRKGKTQQQMSQVSYPFTEYEIQKAFPDHTLDELEHSGIVTRQGKDPSLPSKSVYKVNPPGTKGPEAAAEEAAPALSKDDLEKQKTLAGTQGMFTDAMLAEHFPDHELDELKALGVISDVPGQQDLYFVNEPGTPAPKAAAAPEAATTGGATTVTSETARVVPGAKAAPEAAPEAAPGEAPAEQSPEDKAIGDRLEGVLNRLERYGVTPVDTAHLDDAEALKALEAQEAQIPQAERQGSLRTGKTLQENRIARQLQEDVMNEQSGRHGAVKGPRRQMLSMPQFDVTAERGGGFRVRVSPHDVHEELPPQTPKGKASIIRKTIPGGDFFLPEEGGKLEPYASRERSTEKVGVRGQGGKVGTEAPHGQQGKTPGAGKTGTQPKPSGVGAVAPETPGEAKAPLRFRAEDTVTGGIVRDLETGKPVSRYESKELHPTPEELATHRAAARELAEKMQADHAAKWKEKQETPPKTEEPQPEPAKEEAPKPGTFRVKKQRSKDEFANSPETPVANAVTARGGVLSKRGARDAGKLNKGTEAQWDSVPNLADRSHRKIYDTNGEMPDNMAQGLYDDGLISDPSADTMWRELEKESHHIKNRDKAARAVDEDTATQAKQAAKFGEGQRNEVEAGAKAIPASSLKVGDTVTVDGTPLKVTEISPDADGIVTLENGKKYGVQEVSGDDVIYGEHKPSPEEPGFEPEPEAEGGGTKVADVKKGRIWTRAGTKPMRYIHRDNLNLELRATGNGYDVVDTRGKKPEVIAHFGDRATAKAAYEHGEFTRQEDLPKGFLTEDRPSRVAASYDLSTPQGVEAALKEIHKREPTPEEREKFKPIIEQLKNAKGESAKATSKAIEQILDHYKDVEDKSLDDAVQEIKDAITEATKNC